MKAWKMLLLKLFTQRSIYSLSLNHEFSFNIFFIYIGKSTLKCFLHNKAIILQGTFYFNNSI